MEAEVTALSRRRDGFRASWQGREYDAASVVLACGIVDIHPPFDEWRAAVTDGLLRYCPACDAFEAIGHRIGVIGPLGHAAPKALFLRGYSQDVTLLATESGMDEVAKAQLSVEGVSVLPASDLRLRRKGIGSKRSSIVGLPRSLMWFMRRWVRRCARGWRCRWRPSIPMRAI